MNIGFIVERNVYFKTFGPVIEEAIKKGHQVFCLHNYSQQRTGSKGYQFPDINQTPKFKNGQAVSFEFQTEKELIGKVLENNIHVVVSLEFIEAQLSVKNRLKEKGVFWVSLQSSFDTGPISGKNLAMPDKFFLYSRGWLGWMFEYLKQSSKIQEENFLAFENKLQGKVSFVGSSVFDQVNVIDKKEIRERWSIPENKKIFLLVPFPFGSSLKTIWTKYVYGTRFFSKKNDFYLTKAIREFCDENNALLLVKSRKKDPVKKYLAKVADRVLYDEGFYPTTMMECLAISDICLSFYSTVAMEAACSRVPHICVAPLVRDWKDLQSIYFETIFKEMGDFFDFPGVSWKLSIPDAIEKLKKASFSDFTLDESKLEKYHQKFIGNLSKSYSSDIIKEIKDLICPTNHCH